jgi:hypothetical protein
MSCSQGLFGASLVAARLETPLDSFMVEKHNGVEKLNMLCRQKLRQGEKESDIQNAHSWVKLGKAPAHLVRGWLACAGAAQQSACPLEEARLGSLAVAVWQWSRAHPPLQSLQVLGWSISPCAAS